MTAIRQGPEQVAQAIVATLTTNINGVIDGIWSAWSGGDPATEDAPPKVYPQHIYKFSRRLVDAGNYPVIFVRPTESRQTANHMTTQTGVLGNDEERHRLFVEVGVLSDDIYVLDALVTRLTWAIRTVLLEFPLLDASVAGYGGSLDLGTIAIGRPLDSEFKGVPGAQLQMWGGVEAFVTVEEQIG